MAVAVGALLYQADDSAGTLNDRDLNLRATDLARYWCSMKVRHHGLSFLSTVGTLVKWRTRMGWGQKRRLSKNGTLICKILSVSFA